MSSKQQQETLSFFDSFSKNWKEKALGQNQNEVNIINQRHGYVLEVIKGRSENIRTLDVGCGTGELVHDIARLNINAQGVDFAPEMIKFCQEYASKENLKTAEFKCASIFEWEMESESYDVISANGFIEYISYEQLDEFLTRSFKALRKGGSIVLGSRNRLYNLFSLNQFTKEEISNGQSDNLLTECVHLNNMSDISELLKTEDVPLEDPKKTHVNTGIDVTTRYQFTPSQLVKLLHKHGFEAKGLCPVHIHAFTPAFKSIHPEAHYNISNLLQSVTDDNKSSRYKIIPFASSFMIHGMKK